MNKVFGLCIFFTTMHAMDEQAMVCVKTSSRHTVFVPFSVIRDYVARIPFFALEHETLFVHNYLRTQRHIPKVNSVLGDNTQKGKILACYVPQNIEYQQKNYRVTQNRDDSEDDYDIHINIPSSEHTFLSEQDFEHIRRMPEGPTLCLCNALCGAAMLGIILMLTFCR
jgi:hypothetical protein